MKRLPLLLLSVALGLLAVPALAAGPTPGVDVLVNPPDSQPELEPTIAVNPLNPLNLVAGSKTYGYTRYRHTAYYASTDGGSTWAGGLMDGMERYNANTAPVVAFDRRGNAYFAALAYDECCASLQMPSFGPVVRSTPATAQSSGIYVHKSPARIVAGQVVAGLTWTQHVRLPDASASSGSIHDRPWLAVGPDPHVLDRDNLYVSETLFDEFGVSAISFQRSTDGGLTWSDALSLTGGFASVQGSTVAVDPATGWVYVAWYDYGRQAQRLRRSTDGGQTFEPVQTVAAVSPLPNPLPGERFRTNSFPALAVAPSGNVYLAWADYRRGNADILAQRSKDGGATWQGPARLNDDRGSNHQFMPSVAINASGSIAASWYDNRDDPANHQYTVYIGIAQDRSPSLEALFAGPAAPPPVNLRVGDSPNDPNVGMQTAGNIGDYSGVAVGPTGKVHPIWMGTTRGNQDIYTDVVQ